jgi:hypothetical protein
MFDKGNTSADNFGLLDSLELNFVGSVKLGEHKDLVQIPNGDPIFKSCPAEGGINLEGTNAFRVKKRGYGRKMILVITCN